MRTFLLVVLEKCLGDLAPLLRGGWLVHLQTRLPVGSVKPLHERMFVWPMWRTHVRFHPQAEQEPAQRGRKIPTGDASDPSWIAIKGHLTRTAILAEEGNHRFQRRLFVKILSGLG